MPVHIPTTYQAPNQNPIIRLEDMYPQGFKAPPGYELTGEFRPPLRGDLFIPAYTRYDAYTAVGPYENDQPRLILRKTKTKVITFRSTGEKRLPQRGEWFASIGNPGSFTLAQANFIIDKHEIFTRTETEE